MIIPLTINGKLDYERMTINLQKILSKTPGFKWMEVLVCSDCNTVLENNLVFNPTLIPNCLACLNRNEIDSSCYLKMKIINGECEGFC